ncbi:DoxX family protein [Mesorhizobium sp. 128a]
MTMIDHAATLHRLASKYHLRDATLLAARLLLSVIFLHEGLTLATHFQAGAKAMAAMGVPVPLFVATIALQLGAGLAIATGLFTRIGAIGLGMFCLATALLFHTNLASQNELLHFEKDLAIAGGMFVLAMTGAGAFSLDRLVATICSSARATRTWWQHCWRRRTT